ncbi:response regulator [Burkholderia stagnalis]|uniref:Response regulator n=1 Tax=Burkholderia stagnalis TaxID=1503054 RepID=A0A6L3N162_9BURK|nr:response regulator [Burkholderia stagnalis]RQQ10725.1 response regulator [Burkholderia stagnalis]RQQ37694.1 response regulator [Burkholderia stagnalis]RQY27578.1 response regulator [Burkholderia stagnalis]RQY43906.1 response regulator [Burkholderia stagnalis]
MRAGWGRRSRSTTRPHGAHACATRSASTRPASISTRCSRGRWRAPWRLDGGRKACGIESRPAHGISAVVVQQIGHENVEIATNGRQAMHECASGGHDLIPTDVSMPHVEGLNRRIRGKTSSRYCTHRCRSANYVRRSTTFRMGWAGQDAQARVRPCSPSGCAAHEAL